MLKLIDIMNILDIWDMMNILDGICCHVVHVCRINPHCYVCQNVVFECFSMVAFMIFVPNKNT